MLKPSTVLTGYILERLPSEPIARRIELTRALALISPTREQVELNKMADELENIERRHQQLLLNFKGGRA